MVSSKTALILVINADTGNTARTVTVNLPKIVQDTIIAKKIVNIIIMADDPDIQINMDLAAIKDINR